MSNEKIDSLVGFGCILYFILYSYQACSNREMVILVFGIVLFSIAFKIIELIGRIFKVVCNEYILSRF